MTKLTPKKQSQRNPRKRSERIRRKMNRLRWPIVRTAVAALLANNLSAPITVDFHVDLPNTQVSIHLVVNDDRSQQ